MNFPKEIWRFPIPKEGFGEDFDIELPTYANIVHVDTKQGIDPNFWAEVDPKGSNATVTFKVVATGEPYDSSIYMHVGTFSLGGDLYWFHLLKKVK